MIDFNHPEEYGTEFQFSTLLNLKYKDAIDGKSKYCLDEEARNNVKFYHSAIFGGCDAVAYCGRVVYFSGNPLRANQQTAITIQDLVDNGTQSMYYDPYMIKKYFDL